MRKNLIANQMIQELQEKLRKSIAARRELESQSVRICEDFEGKRVAEEARESTEKKIEPRVHRKRHKLVQLLIEEEEENFGEEEVPTSVDITKLKPKELFEYSEKMKMKAP